jgi:hypothetical protein
MSVFLEISCFWDGGFEVTVGGGLNGYAAETRVKTWDAIEPGLTIEAELHYPESQFARARR